MAKEGYETITVHKLTKARLDALIQELANEQQKGSKPPKISYEQMIDILITERDQRRAKK